MQRDVSRQAITQGHTAAAESSAEARQTLGMSPAAYTDETLAGTPIKAVHIQEIRSQAF